MSLKVPGVFAEWGEGVVQVDWHYVPMVLEKGRKQLFFRSKLEEETLADLHPRPISEATYCCISFLPARHRGEGRAASRELTLAVVIRDTRDAPNRVLSRCHTLSRALKGLPTRLRQLISIRYQAKMRQHFWFALTSDGMLAQVPLFSNKVSMPLPEAYSTTNAKETSCVEGDDKSAMPTDPAPTEHPPAQRSSTNPAASVANGNEAPLLPSLAS